MSKEIKSLVTEINDLAAKKEKSSTEEKASLDAKMDEMKSSLITLEKQLYRVPSGTSLNKSDEMKSFESFLRTMDTKYLRTDRDPEGGYLVPSEMYNQIIHKIVEVSDMRRLAKVVTIGGKSLDVSIGETDMTVYARGEGGASTTSNGTYGRVTIAAHNVTGEAPITSELLQDSAFDMVGEINERAAKKFAAFEGAAFINGTGIDRAQGILQASGVTNVNSGHATQLTADAFWDMLAAFKYRNPTFIMNRGTFAACRKLKDGIGNYLLDAGLNGAPNMALGGIAGQIAGVPVVLMPDMPSVGAGEKAVVLGDFAEAYMIVDRAGMTIVRDDSIERRNGKSVFFMERRGGGAVVNPDALITMTISA